MAEPNYIGWLRRCIEHATLRTARDTDRLVRENMALLERVYWCSPRLLVTSNSDKERDSKPEPADQKHHE